VVVADRLGLLLLHKGSKQVKLAVYWVDAFARIRFQGNPAAVVLAERPLDVDLMQAIAAEHNLAETAFVVVAGSRRAIRWFTPTVEVDLCGHATLASAYALYSHGLVSSDLIEFTSASGHLQVFREVERLSLDFPARPSTEDAGLTERVARALGATPRAVYCAQATMAVFKTEEEVRSLRPHMDQVNALPGQGLVATAPGSQCDFVSRFFAPKLGIPEDPVTGATHCTLIPYWSHRLGKTQLYARQLSARGGELWCEDHGERVRISGHCVLYLRGEIDC
jgi:PhzF family phenazine biosynthesis protein